MKNETRRSSKNTFSSRKKVLVVAAHPDDEVLGAGATIARHVAEGDSVRVLILGEGVTSRAHLSDEEKKKNLNELSESARRANAILGVEKLILQNFPDNQFDTVSLLSLIHLIEKTMKEFSPQVIYTHHASDVNIDHRRVAEAVEAAARPMEGSALEEVFACEIPSSTHWNFIRGDDFRPNAFTEITREFFEKKITALREYKDEIRPFPHPRSPEFLRSLAMMRGGQAGMPLAESFVLLYARKNVRSFLKNE